MHPFFNIADWRKQIKNALSRCLILGTAVSALFSLTGYLGGYHLYLELTSHFKLQYLATCCLALIFFSFTRKKVWCLVSLFCIALNLAAIVPWYIPQPKSAGTPAGLELRFFLANVLTSNRRYQDVLSLIQEEKPEIAVFLEVNETWAKRLDPLRDILPYSLVYPREDNFGIALYSSLPLQNKTVQLFRNEIPSLSASVTWQGKVISILATHPLPPISQGYFEWRNSQIKELSQYLQQLKTPKVVLGDLNMTVWSPYYKSFVEKTKLHNSRTGFGILPTWPAQSPLLLIPLDHCLVSEGIQVLHTRTGRNVGSDHLPLITDTVILQ